MCPILLYSVLAAAIIIIGLIIYARWNFGSLEKCGIPVVKPEHFLLGSALLTYKTPGGLLDIELRKKYGPIFGLYEGRDPQVFICDADLIRSITTKDADHFDAKRPLDMGDPIMNELPDFIQGEKWKVIRSMFSSVINSNVRLKSVHPAMRDAILDFISEIKKQISKSGNGKLEKLAVDDAIYSTLTELMARSQFSIKLGYSDVDSKFVQIVKELLSPPGAEEPALASWTYAFPFIKKFLPNTFINPEPLREFVSLMKQLMDMRRKQTDRDPNTPKDFLDTCIEWHENLDSDEFKKHKINENNVWVLALSMFMAGQPQISLILAGMIYHITDKPEVQRKIQQEVDRVYAKHKGVFDHDALSELTYLNACVTEANRLYPFFFRTERVCMKDWADSERGIRIWKGCTVQICVWATNRNPEYFDNPEEFQPERFLPENKHKLHPYAYTSFGFGPRNCTGKKLAIELTLLMAAYLMKELKFIKRDDTAMKFLPVGPFFGAHEPIVFDVMARNGNEE